jgi:hypothetical protein
LFDLRDFAAGDGCGPFGFGSFKRNKKDRIHGGPLGILPYISILPSCENSDAFRG